MSKETVVNKTARPWWDAWLDTPKEQWEHEYGPWMWKNAPWAEDVKSEELAVSLENVCTDMADSGDGLPTLEFALQEARYVLSTFGEVGHGNGDSYYDDAEIRKLEDFIDKWSLILEAGGEEVPVLCDGKEVIRWKYNDGGRRASGFKGEAGDCVARAVAIAMDRPYRDVYNDLNAFAKAFERQRKRKSSARTGYQMGTLRAYMEKQGWRWVPTMRVGQGCKVHLRTKELPKGRIIVRLSGHVAAVIDGVLHDTHDSSRKGTRCVYGYFEKA